MSGKSEDGSSGPPPQGGGTTSQEFQFSNVSARVPDRVKGGVFSTGVLVLQGAHEFILDFVQGMVQPRSIVARVVLPVSFVPNFLAGLRENLTSYQNQFGPPTTLRQPPPPAAPPSIEEIYGQLKLPDDMLGGVYANGVMIVHTQAEFCLDFIVSCYPRAAVTVRVYLATPQVPALLNALTHSFQQFQHKLAQGHLRPPEPPPPSTN